VARLFEEGAMSWRNRRNGLAVALLSLFVSTSCATHLSSPGAYDNGDGELVVQNRGWETVTVYAVRGPAAIRIGAVDGMSTRTFALTPAVVGPPGMIQLKGLRRITGEEFMSSTFDMMPGATAQWTIEANPRLSHLRMTR
jgi:hypothetical protein